MIGKQIESNPGTPRFAIFLGLVCAGLISVSIVSLNAGFAIFCVPIATVAIALLMSREQPFSMQLTEEAIVVGESFQTIALRSIQAVGSEKSAGANEQFPIHVTYVGGLLTIPRSINESSTAVYEFLCDRFESTVTDNVPSALSGYADEQFTTFGDDKVYCFSARDTVLPSSRRPRLKAVAFGLIMGGLLWFLAGVITPEWFAGGFFAVLFGGLLFLLSIGQTTSNTRQIINWRNSYLIVSPAGIALIQGALKGRLRWDELRNVKFNERPRSFQLSAAAAQTGIHLEVAGSQIVIADIYNEPLLNIHQTIMRYYKGV